MRLKTKMAGVARLLGTAATLSCRLASATTSVTKAVQGPVSPTGYLLCIRSTSFFAKVTAEQLWKSVTSVSNAGRKRGRASGHSRKRSKDLNRGQVIGYGKINMVWPGLNAPVIRGKEVVERVQLPPDKEREEKILKLRDEMQGFRPMKLSPLERGWSGSRAPGRSIGPPDPIGDRMFENFDTIVVELLMVTRMTSTFGRVRRHKATVVVGNGNGLVGFAIGRSPDAKAALRKAKNRAAQKLRYVDRFEGHTVYHDFYAEFGPMKMFVKKKPKGYGVVAQRVIKEVCKMAGIADIHVKLDCRAGCASNLIKAFLLGLHNQRTHQQLADEKRLHLVEFRNETDLFPRVVASPTTGCRKSAEVDPNEECDLNMVVSGGKVAREKEKFVPWYIKQNTKGWQIHLKKVAPYRNAYWTRLNLIAKYGKLCSFLNPEDQHAIHLKLKKEQAEG
ncbi:small ribosomal subunit protein uS5m-like isoform X2 [Ornithodoros turicata]|uniref:small ribosomal subunit protein uS5m-like isoform X2 n=1 Tax=Ornithodoros turicata TaxID=34597 RepID=UPI0031397827